MRAPLHPIVTPLPWRDPLPAFAPFAHHPGAALLYGGDFAILGIQPTSIVRGGFSELEAVLQSRKGIASPSFGPFGCGVLGYFAYEMANQVESLPPAHSHGPSLPDMHFGVFDAVVVFDLKTREAAVISVGFPHTDLGEWEACAKARAQTCIDALSSAPEVATEEPWGKTQWQADWSKDAYEARIEATLDYIRAGDIFQANIAQRFRAPRPAGMSNFGLFCRLARDNPAPFAAFFAVDEKRAVVSSSPERFLQVSITEQGRHVETRPIKGTSPRSANPIEDVRLADALCRSEKDRAENLMIVDLLRNDLSRTAKVGSVKVPELCKLESYATVHHLVSAVISQPQPDISTLEVLRQAFPGGSITGAPKIRAMEIIHELEEARRGPYCGGFGWIGDDGAMDTAIAIRTMIVDGDWLLVSAGGGIVSDSKPKDEYRETLVKAAAMLRTVEAEPDILRQEGL